MDLGNIIFEFNTFFLISYLTLFSAIHFITTLTFGSLISIFHFLIDIFKDINVTLSPI